MKKILYIVKGIGMGGVASVVLNYYRKLSADFTADFIITNGIEKTPKAIIDEIESRNGKIYSVCSFTKNMYRYHREVSKIIKEGNYDIVHDNNKYFGFLSLSAAKKYRVPIRICHVHNNVAKNEKKLHHKLFISVTAALSMHFSNRLVACSEEAGKSMFGEKEFSVLNNAVNTCNYSFDEKAREELRAEFGLSDSYVLMMVARNDPLKRFDFAFKVFGELHKIRNNAKLVLVGLSHEECSQRDRTSYNMLDDTVKENIRFLGRRTDANKLLNMADGFILTSEHEGFGISVVEAQANGLSCFVSDAIPLSVKVTELVSFLPVLENPQLWAKTIDSFESVSYRTHYADEIKNSEYDIENAVNNLKSIYGI